MLYNQKVALNIKNSNVDLWLETQLSSKTKELQYQQKEKQRYRMFLCSFAEFCFYGVHHRQYVFIVIVLLRVSFLLVYDITVYLNVYIKSPAPYPCFSDLIQGLVFRWRKRFKLPTTIQTRNTSEQPTAATFLTSLKRLY